jgi:hypothetical protein
MRDLRIQFNHFVFSGRDGLFKPKDIFERFKRLCELPGATEITSITYGELMKWKAEKIGRIKGGRTNWIMEERPKHQTCPMRANRIIRRGNT